MIYLTRATQNVSVPDLTINKQNSVISLTSIPLRLNPIMQSLHLNIKLSKSVAGTFRLRLLERWFRSAFLASLSGLCIRCMCSRSLSFLFEIGKKKKWLTQRTHMYQIKAVFRTILPSVCNLPWTVCHMLSTGSPCDQSGVTCVSVACLAGRRPFHN